MEQGDLSFINKIENTLSKDKEKISQHCVENEKSLPIKIHRKKSREEDEGKEKGNCKQAPLVATVGDCGGWRILDDQEANSTLFLYGNEREGHIIY